MNNDDFLDMFERELCKYTGSKYCVLVDSCTNAIFLCLEYFKDSGRISSTSIEIPKNTYIGVAQSIKNSGFKVSFKDIKWKGSYKIGNLPILDSAVDFHKNMYQEGTFQCLSFQQKKRLNIGKGGAILLDDSDAYERLKSMSHDGRSKIKNMEDWERGYHMNMIPDDASKGLLILNQINLRPDSPGSYKEYPDLSIIKYFKE